MTTINQVGTEGLDFSSLAAAQRCDAVSAKRAFWQHTAAKFAITISNLPWVRKSSAKSLIFPIQTMPYCLWRGLLVLTLQALPEGR